MDVFIYKADTWCEDCIAKVKADIAARGETPANPGDEHTYDSDDYPKGPFSNDESDSPTHCCKCHVFMEQPLTSAGYQYVAEILNEEGVNTLESLSDVGREWASYYGFEFNNGAWTSDEAS